MATQFFAAFPMGMFTNLMYVNYAKAGVTPSIAWLQGTMTISGAIFIVVLAFLTWNRGRRQAIAVGAVLTIIGMLLALVSVVIGIPTLFYIATPLAGAVVALMWHVPFATTDFSVKNTRGLDFSLVVCTTAVGAAFGALLINFSSAMDEAFELSSGTIGFMLCLICSLLVLIIPWYGLRPVADAMRKDADYDVDAAAYSVNYPIGVSGAVGAIIALTVSSLVTSLIWLTATVHVASSRNDSGSSLLVFLGMSSMIVQFTSYIVAPIFGFMVDKLSRLVVIIVGYGMAITGCLALVVASDLPILVVLALMILMIGGTATKVASGALLIDVTPRPQRVMLQGVAGFIVTTISPLGTLAGGLGMPVLSAICVVVLGVVLFPVIWGTMQAPQYD